MSLRVAHRRLVRILATGTVALVASGTALTFAATPAFASASSMESQFVAAMNGARASAGLRAYSVAYDLTSVARSHSSAMARSQNLYHNPSLTTDIVNWQAVGENVGEGPSVADIQDAFMHSPEHRANILDHDFTQVGVGVSVDSNGIVWVTEDFRQPMHTSTSSSSSAGTTTHHSTSHVATHVTSQAASTPRHVTSVAPTRHTTPVTARPAPRPAHHVTHPVPAQSPQALLLARLTAIRSAAAQSPSSDPVDAAFDYLANMTSLTSA